MGIFLHWLMRGCLEVTPQPACLPSFLPFFFVRQFFAPCKSGVKKSIFKNKNAHKRWYVFICPSSPFAICYWLPIHDEEQTRISHSCNYREMINVLISLSFYDPCEAFKVCWNDPLDIPAYFACISIKLNVQTSNTFLAEYVPKRSHRQVHFSTSQSSISPNFALKSILLQLGHILRDKYLAAFPRPQPEALWKRS